MDKDWEFLLSCVKHTNVKPDFGAVAAELGLKSATTAYQRHWAILKKHGLAGNTGKGGRKGSNPKNPATVKSTGASSGTASNRKANGVNGGQRVRPAATKVTKATKARASTVKDFVMNGVKDEEPEDDGLDIGQILDEELGNGTSDASEDAKFAIGEENGFENSDISGEGLENGDED